MSLGPVLEDAIDRRAAQLRALGMQPPRRAEDFPNSNPDALLAMLALMQTRIGAATGRRVEFDLDGTTFWTFDIVVFVRTSAGLTRKPILTIACHRSCDPSMPPGYTEFYASQCEDTIIEVPRPIYLCVPPEEYPAIADRYTDAFIDIVAECVVRGWDIV